MRFSLQRRAEQRRHYELARLRLARMTARGGELLADPLREACEIAANTIQVERVGIWLFVEERQAIRCFRLFERSKGKHSEGVILYAVDIPTYFKALEERRYINADDARTHPATKELTLSYLEPLGITSMLDAPIYLAGQVAGVVCHEHTAKPRTWTSEEIDFAGSVADNVALRLEEAARNEAEQLARGLHEQAVDLEKMKATFRLAAGAAHDIRNMVSVVRWAARTISEEIPDNERVTTNAKRIVDATESVLSITRDLESLGRNHGQSPSVLSLGAALERMLPLLRAAVGDRYQVELTESQPIGSVMVDGSQLERLMVNLVLNARDAMPDGGVIGIGLSETSVGDGSIPDGSYELIAVSDHGVGIPASVREQIFEPFFTTKERGGGTGLGLTVVYAIADRYGGFVHVDSVPDQGTTFRVYLPRVAAGT
jgi:signal transduction histidine kinase